MSDKTAPTEFELDAIVPAVNNVNPIEEFIQTQIELWGFEAVQKMFDTGFEPYNINGKVIWGK